MGYRRATIYFASGTGNSYRVAAWLHQACLDRGVTSELIPVDAGRPADEIDASQDQLVAMAYPAHGLMPPWSAIKFLLKMPRKRGAHFFAAPTRGCFMLGGLAVPGAAGLASWLPALLLPWVGYRVRGAASFDMPVNMTNLHPPLGEKSTKHIIGRARRRAEVRFGRLLEGRSIWWTWNNLWELCWAVPLLVFFPLFPVLYLLLGRLSMAKLMFANNDCRGCGACARSCPNGAIVMIGGKTKKPVWSYRCEVCLRCLNTCPQKAIEAGWGWGALLWFIATLPLPLVVFPFVREHLPWVASIDNWMLHELVYCLYYYPAVILAYWLLTLLARLRPLNWLFSHTTPTRLYRRYREPHTRRQDLLRGSRGRTARGEPEHGNT